MMIRRSALAHQATEQATVQATAPVLSGKTLHLLQGGSRPMQPVFGGWWPGASPKQEQPALPRKSLPRRIAARTLKTIQSVVLSVLVLVGGGNVYSHVKGHVSPMPQLYRIEKVAPELKSLKTVNSAKGLPANATDAARWKALENSIKLLEKVAPQAAEWMKAQHQSKEIVFNGLPFTASETSTYAAYNPFLNTLYLGPIFWSQLNDGERAVVLGHEFWHSRQNWGRLIADGVMHAASTKLFWKDWLQSYASPTEDEAFLFTRELVAALDIPMKSFSDYYLEYRDLKHLD